MDLKSRVAQYGVDRHPCSAKLSMMIDDCGREASSGARSGPMEPLSGAKLQRPEGSSGGRPWVGLEAPRGFRPS